jgi:hypothetical protein
MNTNFEIIASDRPSNLSREEAILNITANELEHLVPDVHLQVVLAAQLPTITGEGYFFKVNFPAENCHRYWIDWNEDLGAWVEADGQQATIVVREENAEELDPSPVICLSSHIGATCLSLRGRIAIHANVVAVGGVAIAFAGASGMGKSTLTAYCASQGASFVTDDVLILDRQGLVAPGSQRIKLFPSTGEMLGLDVSEETTYKIHYEPSQLGAVVERSPVPLKAIYLLETSEDDCISARSLPASQAILHLLKHSYHTSAIIPDHPPLFDAYVQLVSQVSVQQLFYPRDLERLPDIYKFLQQEVQLLPAKSQ